MLYKDMTQEQKKLHQARTTLRGLILREKLIAMKGGCCSQCGYRKCSRSMSFHHRDPQTKSFELAVTDIRNRPWEEIVIELDKCDLLCNNCHGEVEDDLAKKRFAKSYGIYVPDDEPWAVTLKKIVDRNKRFVLPSIKKNCKHCGKEFYTKHDFDFCSEPCWHIFGRKVPRPSKEELNELINRGIPWVHLGKKYGVCDNSIKKWAKQYGISFLPRRKTKSRRQI